jgi:DNA-binding transcriptional LysR family regulator
LLAGHAALRLVSSDGEPHPWRLARGRERWEGLPDGPIAANSIGLMSTLARHGMGIAGLSARYAASLVAQGLLERVLPEWCLPTMTVWCVTPGRRLLPRRTSVFVAMLEAQLQRPPSAPR